METRTEKRAVEIVQTFIFRKPWLDFFRDIETDRERGVILRAFCDFVAGEDTRYMTEESPELQTIYKILCAESVDSAERYLYTRKK